ncbi:conserved hypothetical protein [Neospora caninum Liverpool]|uniref:Epimerase family protein n=1 Tax=Neospora caninum (strain Liverpool) TaxID=572307 RepID=F0VQ87_NEOCL|nr:conserved hypothetical protein [Neospora caninum Liverpool]CBZ55884.1 conserved hypothetical protein [Neospora caninum Liverpool]CEL70627.1 TPA: Epimerase family protein [Neospora caninum Liverpool]|eukprot:XP_003885910.1 conserved hypothetical protein [Neospora caninum Liverpool]
MPRAEENEQKENEYFTVVLSGSHGMLGGFLVDMFRDGAVKIDGRPVRCRRLTRTRRRCPPTLSHTHSMQQNRTEDHAASSLPPRPAFLPPANFVDAEAEEQPERGEETIREAGAKPLPGGDLARLAPVGEAQDVQVGKTEKRNNETEQDLDSRYLKKEADKEETDRTKEKEANEDDILWDIPGQWIEADKLEGVDAVIHLAGEPLAEKGEVAGELAADRASLASSAEAGGSRNSGGGAQLAETDLLEEVSRTPESPLRGISGSWGAQKLRAVLDSEDWLRSLGAWTAAKKKEILDSRVNSIRLLVDTFKRLRRPPKMFFVASGVGVYGIDTGDEICDEDTAAGKTFVAEVSVNLEQEAAEAASRQSSVFKEYASPEADLPEQLEKDLASAGSGSPDCRVVFLRFGVMFSMRGGILPRLLPLYKMRLGSRLGGGQQWMSWISLHDAARAILFLLQKEQDAIQGPVNICSPEPMRNETLAAALHEVLHPNAWFTFTMPVPASMLRLVLGQLADEVLLGGQRVAPRRLSGAGFEFDHSSISEAIVWSLDEQKRRTAPKGENEKQTVEQKKGDGEEHEHTAEERIAAFDSLKSQQLELAEQMREQERKQEEKRHEMLLKRRQSAKMMDKSRQSQEQQGEEAAGDVEIDTQAD